MSDASRYMGDNDYDNAFESYRVVLEKLYLNFRKCSQNCENLFDTVPDFRKSKDLRFFREKVHGDFSSRRVSFIRLLLLTNRFPLIPLQNRKFENVKTYFRVF